MSGIATSAGVGSAATNGGAALSRVDTFTVGMPELGGRTRRVRVYLPKGYEAGTGRYPTLYMQDAQQLCSPGPFGVW